MKWLILGQHGMVGGSLFRYLARSHVDVAGTQRRDPAVHRYLVVDVANTGVASLRALFFGFDVVVNAVVDKQLDPREPAQCRSAFFVNAYFPHLAARAAAQERARFIHISTDGVFSGRGGPYDEGSACDGEGVYSLSKRLGEVSTEGSLNVRCSVVGHEPGAPRSLLCWFLSQNLRTEVQGYTDHIWNGVTCLQLAQFIRELVESDSLERLRRDTPVIHFSPNPPMSKYDLLCAVRRVYGASQRVLPTASGTPVSRILVTRFGQYYGNVSSFENALRQQRDFEEGATGDRTQ